MARGGRVTRCRLEVASITQFKAHTCNTRQNLVGYAWKIELLRLGDAKWKDRKSIAVERETVSKLDGGSVWDFLLACSLGIGMVLWGIRTIVDISTNAREK